ncbi:hypothetical protein [Helicobacter acinonychis]|uniref:Hac prophage II protein n=1 Tax=Helicobacter acinonychis (strain Sheeba) TaxID=382638 RepID=Q17VL0_HELAH|nr:hypothetical protein [Helicobacter acinonychis]CAK00316.1 hypothetical protein Hac_1607 [Helicobacter acinonychis str. Sheeba]
MNYLMYLQMKAEKTDLSFKQFIEKLEALQKTHTLKESVCSVKNKRVTSYCIMLQRKGA